MGEPSKELLDLPSEPKPPSLIVTSRGERAAAAAQGGEAQGGVSHRSTPQEPRVSQWRSVLGRVKDFLGEMAKANEKLQLDVKNKRPEEYDIEALTGNEKEYIEMDLLLGVADLHSEKAVEVAEATLNGFPPAGRSFACSSSDSEDDSDDSDEDGGDEPNMSTKDECKDGDEPKSQASKGKKRNKRQKIVVLN